MINASILGTGSSLPDKILKNSDLERMVDTSDDWITARTGIKERRIASEGESTSTFAVEAAKKALAMSGISADQLGMIIVATVTPDFPFPATACIVQNELKATNAAAFDISAACSGFIYGLSIVQKMIETGTIKHALVIGAEVLTKIVDWTDRGTCCLFGDGAGAVVVGSGAGRGRILSSHIHSDGSYWELLHQPACGSRNPASQKVIDDRLSFIKMQGNDVFKLAVRAMEDVAHEALNANGLSLADLDLLIPHQANRRIIDAIGKRLGLSEDKVFINVHNYGNTSAASIPIAFDEAIRSEKIRNGQLVLFDAFGGGLTWGSVLVRC